MLKKIIEILKLAKSDSPSPLIKQMTIRRYAKKYKPKIFIETGTYEGEMVDGMKDVFDRIYSIELGDELYRKAKVRLSKHKHISILYGDSAKVLSDILDNINEPCLFWLDAHYSAGITARGEVVTPILQELNHIFSHEIKNHVILIDDAKDFTGKIENYPPLQRVQHIALIHGYKFKVKNNIMRIYKNKIRK